jgi:hypothetical protein
MGFFKDLNTLKKQGEEIRKTYDVGDQMANAQAQMAQAQQMMAQQTAAANLASTGTPASATVVAARQGGGMVNFQPIMEVDLTVFPPAGAPYPATMTGPMPTNVAGRLAPGATLQVKIDPQNPQSVWIDPTS